MFIVLEIMIMLIKMMTMVNVEVITIQYHDDASVGGRVSGY